MKIYIDMHTNEKITEDEAYDYALEKLGFKGCNDKKLENEFEESFKEDIVNWFFSGDYVEKEITLDEFFSGRY